MVRAALEPDHTAPASQGLLVQIPDQFTTGRDPHLELGRDPHLESDQEVHKGLGLLTTVQPVIIPTKVHIQKKEVGIIVRGVDVAWIVHTEHYNGTQFIHILQKRERH